jgi:hypothetical protein
MRIRPAGKGVNDRRTQLRVCMASPKFACINHARPFGLRRPRQARGGVDSVQNAPIIVMLMISSIIAIYPIEPVPLAVT